MRRSIFFFIFLLIIGCGEKPPVNIYVSKEFNELSKKDIIVGDSNLDKTLEFLNLVNEKINDK